MDGAATLLKHLSTTASLEADADKAHAAVEAAVKRGLDAGWLRVVREDEDTFHLKDPAQTPERAAQATA